MAELADASDLGSGGFTVQVRFLLLAPKNREHDCALCFLFRAGERYYIHK